MYYDWCINKTITILIYSVSAFDNGQIVQEALETEGQSIQLLSFFEIQVGLLGFTRDQ